MIDRTVFAAGLAKVAVAFGTALTKDRTAIYFEMLGPEFTSAEWAREVDRVIREETYFPVVAAFLKHKRLAAEAALQEGASRAFDLCFRDGRGYVGSGAPYWDAKELAAKYGSTAAAAFEAAGGHDVFTSANESVERLPFVRGEYVKHYLRLTVTAHPALPAAVEVPALPAHASTSIGHDRARALLAQVRRAAAVAVGPMAASS